MNPYTDNPELDTLVRERMETLPAPVRRLFDDPASAIYIESFAASAGLSEEQTQQLQHEIMLLMLGFTARDDFSFVLMTELDMPPRQAFAVEHWVTNIFLKDAINSIGEPGVIPPQSTVSPGRVPLSEAPVQPPESGALIPQYVPVQSDVSTTMAHPMQGTVSPVQSAAYAAPTGVPTPYSAAIAPVPTMSYEAPQAFMQPPVATLTPTPTPQQYIPPVPAPAPVATPTPVAPVVPPAPVAPQYVPPVAVPTPQLAPIPSPVAAQSVAPVPPIAAPVQTPPPVAVAPTVLQTMQPAAAVQPVPTSAPHVPLPVQPISMPTVDGTAVPMRLTPPPVATPMVSNAPTPPPLPVVAAPLPAPTRTLTPPVPRIASGSLDINKPLPKPRTIFHDIASVRAAISPEGVARYDKPFAQAPAYGTA